MAWIPALIRRQSQSLNLYVVVALLLATLWGAIAFDLDRVRKEILSSNDKDLTNLTLAFSKEIEASVKTIDITLIALREHWQGDPGRLAKIVRQRQSHLEKEFAFQIGVIGANGTLLYSSLEQPAKPVDLSDREHFRIHRQRSTDELFISKPLLGRVSQRWAIQFTRPMYDSRDEFAGVVVLSVSPEYFYRFYRSIQLPPDSAITLVQQGGEVLARYPDPEGALGKRLSDTPFQSSLAPESGFFRRPSQIDGIDRVYAWRRSEPHGLVVIVGHALPDIMAPYAEQRSRAILAGAGISLLLLLIGYLNLWSLRQRQREEKRLADNEERWRLALAAAGDGVWDWDVTHGRVVFSPAWKTMLGHAVDDVGDQLDEWKSRVHPDDMSRVIDSVQAHLGGITGIYASEHRMRCKDGGWKWVLVRSMVIARGPDGSPLRMVGTITDISPMKEMAAKLTTLATTDALTGLSNRRCFLERLEKEIARIKRYPQASASALMADIDFFKKINDTHGHGVGDDALRHFAALLGSAVRETDAAGRMGGEEFAILLPETSPEGAALFAERLCSIVRATPLTIGTQSIAMTVSIGVAAITPGDVRPEDVLQRADLALYEAKNLGRDRVVAH